MAYKADEQIIEISKTRKGRDDLVVRRIIPNDKNKLQATDIRLWYESGGELKPSQKGIRLNTEEIAEVVGYIYQSMSEEEREELKEIIEKVDSSDNSEDNEDTAVEGYDPMEDFPEDEY